MEATYKDFFREPSKPHQCMHYFEKDGSRCRGTAMHNELMCFHHRDDDIPTVIQNDPFLIEHLSDRDSIQQAVADVAARLACNHMDLKRAGILVQALQVASSNLSAKERLTASLAALTQPAPATRQDPIQSEQPGVEPTSNAVILSEERSDEPKDPERFGTTTTDGTFQPNDPTTLPTTNNQQPATLPTLTAAAASADHLPLTTRLCRKMQKSPVQR